MASGVWQGESDIQEVVRKFIRIVRGPLGLHHCPWNRRVVIDAKKSPDLFITLANVTSDVARFVWRLLISTESRLFWPRRLSDSAYWSCQSCSHRRESATRWYGRSFTCGKVCAVEPRFVALATVGGLHSTCCALIGGQSAGAGGVFDRLHSPLSRQRVRASRALTYSCEPCSCVDEDERHALERRIAAYSNSLVKRK